MNTFAESVSCVLCKINIPKNTYNSLPRLCLINRTRSTSCTPQYLVSLPLYFQPQTISCHLFFYFCYFSVALCTLDSIHSVNLTAFILHLEAFTLLFAAFILYTWQYSLCILGSFHSVKQSYNTVHKSKGGAISAICLHLTHCTQRIMWCIAITWRLMPQSSVNLIFFSETTGPIGAILGRNVHLLPIVHKY